MTYIDIYIYKYIYKIYIYIYIYYRYFILIRLNPTIYGDWEGWWFEHSMP